MQHKMHSNRQAIKTKQTTASVKMANSLKILHVIITNINILAAPANLLNHICGKCHDGCHTATDKNNEIKMAIKTIQVLVVFIKRKKKKQNRVAIVKSK